MIIQINDKWRVRSDSRQWIVQSKKEKEWTNKGYYTNFLNALTALSEKRIRLIDSAVPNKILAAIEDIKRESSFAASTFTHT